MSRVRLECPCERRRILAFDAPGTGEAELGERACPHPGCERVLELRLDGLVAGAQRERPGLRACLACGHPELYTRKDFPPALGIGLVVVAALLVPVVPYYLSLVAAALIDAVLYRFAPDVVVCYLCSTQHRGYAREPRHPAFDRTIEERLRYGTGAVMGSPMRAGGTAGAPDPEH